MPTATARTIATHGKEVLGRVHRCKALAPTTNHLKPMAFILYRVDADLVEPTATVAGTGSICQTLSEAMAEQVRLESNPRYCNIRLTERKYGF